MPEEIVCYNNLVSTKTLKYIMFRDITKLKYVAAHKPGFWEG